MKCPWNSLSRLVAKIRFKLFRLMSIVLLGRESGQSVIGQCVVADLEFANTEAARRRILERRLLSEACVQNYDLKNVPDCWRAMFSRCAVFPRRYAYLLQDVAIGPDSGVVFARHSRWFKGDGLIFVPSVCHHYFLFQCGVQEVMRRAKLMDGAMPVCSMPVIGYYHEMLEGLLRVVKARSVFGEIKVLVPAKRPKYIDEMLEFVGVETGNVIASDCPIVVGRCVLIPRWSDCGENLRSDVCELRDYLVSRLTEAGDVAQKIYISRARSRRALPNEHEIERVLEDKGFRVLYFESMPFAEQLKAVRSADVVVSPHGAGLSNLIVAKPGTKVVEIMTQGWANSCYGHLASSLELDYMCLNADDSGLLDIVKSL